MLFDLGGVLIGRAGWRRCGNSAASAPTRRRGPAGWLPLGTPLRGPGSARPRSSPRGGGRLGARPGAGRVPRRIRMGGRAAHGARWSFVAAVQATASAGLPLQHERGTSGTANYEAIPLTEAFAYRFLSFELGWSSRTSPSSSVVRTPAGPARDRCSSSTTTRPTWRRRRRAGFVARHVRGVDGAPGAGRRGCPRRLSPGSGGGGSGVGGSGGRGSGVGGRGSGVGG